MSFQAMAWAVKQRIPSNEKFILIMLSNYASNDDADCFPSIETLMRDTGFSKSTVQRSLKNLANEGYLSSHERWEKGRQLSNSYRLSISFGEGVTQTPRSVTQTPMGVTQTPSGVSHRHPNLSEEPINQSIPKENDFLLIGDFNEFWDAYPKRPSNPKEPAFKSYLKARKQGATQTEIMVGLLAYARTRRNEDPKFTAQAVTWLNQKRWQDDYGPAKQTRKFGNFV